MSDPYARAAEVLRRHEAELLAVPGVHGAGVGRASDHGGEDVPCLVVFADPALPRAALPDALEGLAVHLVRTPGFSPQPSPRRQGE
jgi:hypothetical protein